MVLDKELPDQRVENEARILGAAGNQVFVLALDYHSRKTKIKNFEYFSVYQIPCKKWVVKKLRPFSGTALDLYSVIWHFIIKKFVRSMDIDILHVHDLYMGLPARHQDVDYVVDLHENYPATVVSYNWSRFFPLNCLLSKARWKNKERKILRQAKGIITLSDHFAQSLAEEYQNLMNIEKFCIYPNVPDLKQLDALFDDKTIFDPKGKFTLLYFGVIAERRGIFDCFMALDIARKNIPNLHFLFVGPVDNADKKKFQNCINSYSENVTHIPWLEFKDFASLIKNIDIAVSPIKKNEQHESGVANKIFQYMYFQKPVIVSNCRPQEEIINNHQCGYVFEAGNASHFADVIQIAFNQKKLFSSMAANARTAVKKYYNTTTAGKKLIDFYHKICPESIT